MARYELPKGQDTLVWVIERRGAAVFTRYGKPGDKGRAGAQTFRDDARAIAHVEAQIQQKLAAGYSLVDQAASVDAPLGPSQTERHRHRSESTALRLRDAGAVLRRYVNTTHTDTDTEQPRIDTVVECFRRVLKGVRGRGAWWLEHGAAEGSDDDVAVIYLYRQSIGDETYRVGLRLLVRVEEEIADDSWSLDTGGVASFLEDVSEDEAWRTLSRGRLVSVDVIDEEV